MNIIKNTINFKQNSNFISHSTSLVNLLLAQYFLLEKTRSLLKSLQILSPTFLESFIPSKGPTLISRANSKD